MNAFTRQEISAIRPSEPSKGWSRVPTCSAAQSPQYHAVVDAGTRHIVAYHATKTASSIHSVLEEIALCIDSGPAGGPLLLSLDLKDCMEEEHVEGNGLFELLERYLWSDRELMIHLGHPDDDAWCSLEMYKRLQKAGIQTMVDAGMAWDLPSTHILLDAHIIRFNAARLPPGVDQLLELAQRIGVQTLYTNIANRAQVAWALKQGIDWLQFNPA